MSLFKRGKTTSVSGSPKRALNSITLMPAGVFIRPPYRTPVSGQPSATMAPAALQRIFLYANSLSSSVMKGRPVYAPIPPVLGPLSPSKARLWSCESGMGKTSVPLTKHIKENSGPVRKSSTTTLPLPKDSSSSMLLRAASASSRFSAITTPLPAARPSYLSTAGNGRPLT